ncbi:hypothetical protein M3201_11235 [Paenibacillus motobuensis]|uniref:hypothetical protein n=1 Tax=Paenibacillus TaxID=44249 RepID=UPI00204054EB|nr:MULTISPECIES: hypothetical protein [Paenibacillus]MCM3040272.1 hypothetical protein [Paenibacillus lutimineralis]MCM3647376.1 hypothetical protein [Paenibacillus motobuensis]
MLPPKFPAPLQTNGLSWSLSQPSINAGSALLPYQPLRPTRKQFLQDHIPKLFQTGSQLPRLSAAGRNALYSSLQWTYIEDNVQ